MAAEAPLMRAGAGLLLPLLLAASASALADEVRLVGYAYDRHGGAPLYTENHFQEFSAGRLRSHRIEYRSPDGALICEKTLEYGAHPYAPAFQLTDLRDGYVEGASYAGDVFRMFRRANGALESAAVGAGDDLVADSGFDRFIKAKLPALLAHQREHLRLAVAGRLTTLAFRVEADSGDAPPGEVRLKAGPDSMLRFFVAPIFVTYDAVSGRLVRYEGISNIRNSSGDRYDARIEFPADPGARPAGFAGAP